MEKVAVDSVNWTCKPKRIPVRSKNEKIQWTIESGDWEFVPDATEAIKVDRGEDGTDPAGEFDQHAVVHINGKRKRLTLRSKNNTEDFYKYTLTMVKDNVKRELDPSILNTGEDRGGTLLKTIAVFFAGLAAGAFGAPYVGF